MRALILGCPTLRDYEVSETVGEGRSGVVFKARHGRTGQMVALKKLAVHEARDGVALTSVQETALLRG